MQSSLRFAQQVCWLFVLCISLSLHFGLKTSQATQTDTPVLLSALVTGPDKEPITDLTQADFQVLENGQPQTITIFQQAKAVSYGIIIDNTGSMRELTPQVLQIARALVKAHQPEDQAFLARMFDGEVLLPVPWTSDKTLLFNSLNTLSNAKGTMSLLAALLVSLEYATKRSTSAAATHPQWSLFLISDGIEKTLTPNQLRDLKKRFHTDAVQVFPIRIQKRGEETWDLFGKTQGQAARELLDQLASESGGRVLHLEDKADPAQVGELAARYLHSQYVIGYSPAALPNSKGARKIQVKLVGKPNRSKLTLSTWLPN